MDNQIKQATPEDIRVAKLTKQITEGYRLTPKFKEWERLFLNKSNKTTFGNATQSAIQAYNLDPIKQYHVARQIGHENMTKHDNLIGRYYEAAGKTPATIYDLFWNMMLARKDVDQLYAIAESMKVSMPNYKPVTNATYIAKQENNQFNVGGDMSLTFIKEEVKEDAGNTNTSTVPSGDGQPQV